jgi:hypothetical protein
MDGERTADARQKPPGEAGVGGAMTAREDLDVPARGGAHELGKLEKRQREAPSLEKSRKDREKMGRIQIDRFSLKIFDRNSR